MPKKPELVEVAVFASSTSPGRYELWCRYDDGVDEGEVWGSLAETEIVAAIRRKDIRRISTPRFNG